MDALSRSSVAVGVAPLEIGPARISLQSCGVHAREDNMSSVNLRVIDIDDVEIRFSSVVSDLWRVAQLAILLLRLQARLTYPAKCTAVG
ncbi:hypothetical protein J7T55_004994 [Diaporthe amygdali]|uniref:uncharacterized protein n=1 Tax=Phomopsis amygdali TaxID=1214568 RepID=UPI0022FECE79|nr:uncharacterized protein J7T55_004994 [Diaporthe amygdali]KAJ0116049.1 hypothetical protein J7T55_004994 [Diaporthe amygdali]